jgi:hypothetical protein
LVDGIGIGQTPRSLAGSLSSRGGNAIQATERPTSWAVALAASDVELLLDAPTTSSPTRGAVVVLGSTRALKLADLVQTLGAYRRSRAGKVASATFEQTQNGRTLLLTAYLLSSKPAPESLVTKIVVLFDARDAGTGP